MAGARFRDSVGWQKAMALIVEVYTVTGSFPKDEMFWAYEPTSKRFCLRRK